MSSPASGSTTTSPSRSASIGNGEAQVLLLTADCRGEHGECCLGNWLPPFPTGGCPVADKVSLLALPLGRFEREAAGDLPSFQPGDHDAREAECDSTEKTHCGISEGRGEEEPSVEDGLLSRRGNPAWPFQPKKDGGFATTTPDKPVPHPLGPILGGKVTTDSNTNAVAQGPGGDQRGD